MPHLYIIGNENGNEELLGVVYCSSRNHNEIEQMVMDLKENYERWDYDVNRIIVEKTSYLKFSDGTFQELK